MLKGTKAKVNVYVDGFWRPSIASVIAMAGDKGYNAEKRNDDGT